MELLRTLRALEPYTESIPCYLEGQELFIIRRANAARYAAVREALEGLGFTLYSERTMGEVLFYVYTRQNESLFCSFSPYDRFIRIVRELDHRFPVESPAVGEARVDPLVTQLQGAFLRTDAGMGYVIRLCDGRFILIDGFVGEHEEPDHLMEVIASQHTGKGKPVIAAWVVTHPHGDHYWGLAAFMKEYGDAVELHDLIYNFARPDIVNFSTPTPFYEFLEAWRERIHIYTPHAGERFVYADATFDVLFAAEDIYPDRSVGCNDTSLVMMMELCGRRVLWLGDLKKAGGDFVAKRYPEELLECEFLQVGHHGYGVNSKKIYRAAKPEILMWPCADYWFPVVSQLEPNQVLLGLESVRVLDICGQGDVVYNFKKPVEQTSFYRAYASGEVVLDEHFNNTRVFDLHWNSVVGGASGYHAATLAMGEGELTVESRFDAYSVLQFAKRGLMDRLPGYTLRVRGRAEESELFGLFWNYPNVTVFSEEALLPIPVSAEGDFDLCLRADEELGEMTLVCNGEEIVRAPYERCPDSGLSFVLRNATLKLESVSLTAGASALV